MNTAQDRSGRELKDALPRALYVADGGELPAMERHYLMHQERYRKMAAAGQRTMASFAERTGTEEGWAMASELEQIAKDVEESRG